MSLNKKRELLSIAKVLCRDLRKNPTKAEKILWKALRNRKLLNMKFRRQQPIFHDLTGRETFFIADFYCHEKNLIIELDGTIHNFKIKQDKERTEILNSLGLRIIRFSNNEVENNLNNVIKKISKEVEFKD